MWSNRLLIAAIAVTLCAGTSLSIGSGRAAALPPTMEAIVVAAEDVSTALAPKFAQWGLGALAEDFGGFAKKIESLFVPEATKLTPAADDIELTSLDTDWKGFAPRTPLPEEVAPVRGQLPSMYAQASEMLCGTALDLLNEPDKASWNYAITQVDNQIAKQTPMGKQLVMYSELNDIEGKFQSGCYCAGTAELAVFVAKERYCTVPE
jgi:hypothetical protein